MQNPWPVDRIPRALAPRIDSKRYAVEILARCLQEYPLQVAAHFPEPELRIDPTIGLKVRAECRAGDLYNIDETLRRNGWQAERARLAPIDRAHDVRRFVHDETGATLVLIISLPARVTR